VYEGNYVDDVMHGRGKLTNPDGSLQHTGLWENGQEAKGSVKIQRVTSPITYERAFSS
jgi:hypothetical protein